MSRESGPRWLALLLLAGIVVGACKEPAASGPRCQTRDDCAAGADCVEGVCSPCPEPCAEGEVCQDGQCRPPTSCAGRTCLEGESCVEGACRADCAAVTCPDGEACAQGKCYPAECGGTACAEGHVCFEGRCTELACVGVVCSADQACAAGRCLPQSCAGVACAEGNVCEDGQCVSTACVGVVCSAEAVCAQGRCVPTACEGVVCPQEYGCVEGRCVDVACEGTHCPADELCARGQCLPQSCAGVECAEGNVCQGGRCVAPGCVDVDCGAEAICAQGRCVPTLCEGLACPAGAGCVEGLCVDAACEGLTCPTGEACAKGQCLPQSCAGMECAEGNVCQGGRCVAPGCVDVDCGAEAICSQGSCLPASCAGVACPVGEGCADGHCVDPGCQGKACGPATTCREGACVACLAEELDCADGRDEDCDGLTDCDDPGCTAAPCAPRPPVNVARPAISGTAGEWETLSASQGSWTGTLPMDFAYQWQSCDASGAACADVAGATAASYELLAPEVGRTVRVVVTATNVAGNASASSDPTPVVADSTWWNPAWRYRKPLVIDHLKVAADLTGFPVLVDLTDVDLARAQASGADLAFADAAGNEVPFEREAFAADRLVAWVKVPAVSAAADTTFYLYYGNPAATDRQQAAAVWAGYSNVYHFGQGDPLDVHDSTGVNDGTNLAVTAGTGVILGAASFPGGQSISADIVGADSGAGGYNTVSFWLDYTGALEDAVFAFYDGGDHAYDLWMQNPSFGFNTEYGDCVGIPCAGLLNRWVHVAAVFYNGVPDPTHNQLWIDGVQQALSDLLAAPRSTTVGGKLYLASVHGYEFTGLLDEVRVGPGLRPPGWIATEFANQSDPHAFVTAGAEEPAP